MTTDDENKPGLAKKAVALVGLMGSAVFLANLPMFPPEIPDILPVVGNLDELVASGIFLWSARTLGIKPVHLLRSRKKRKQLEAGRKLVDG